MPKGLSAFMSSYIRSLISLISSTLTFDLFLSLTRTMQSSTHATQLKMSTHYEHFQHVRAVGASGQQHTGISFCWNLCAHSPLKSVCQSPTATSPQTSSCSPNLTMFTATTSYIWEKIPPQQPMLNPDFYSPSHCRRQMALSPHHERHVAVTTHYRCRIATNSHKECKDKSALLYNHHNFPMVTKYAPKHQGTWRICGSS